MRSPKQGKRTNERRCLQGLKDAASEGLSNSAPGRNNKVCLYQLSERLAGTGQTGMIEEIESERAMQMSLREAIGEAVERAHDAGSLVFGEIKASILAGYALQDPLDETAIELGIIQEASRRSLPLRFEKAVTASRSDGVDEGPSQVFGHQVSVR